MARHRWVHNLKFKCGYLSCPASYKSYSALYTHCKRHHFVIRKNCQLIGNVSADKNLKFSSVNSVSSFPASMVYCTVPCCEQLCTDFKDLLKHLKTVHLSMNCEIQCPFSNCSSKYSILSSFTSHISRCHRLCAQNQPHHCSTVETDMQVNDDLGNALDIPCCSESSPNSTASVITETDLYALFLLKLESKLIVPQSTIQVIFEEFLHLAKSADKHLSTVLSNDLGLSEIQSEQLKVAFDNLSLSATLATNGKLFNTIYKRSSYYKSKFNYVSPVEIFLGYINRKKCCFHYIPIQQQLLNYCKLFGQELFKRPLSKELILKDFWDGSLYEHLQTSVSLNLFLYQDSFEVVNPIGSSKNKHKLLAVYCMIGNIPAAQRMSLDNILLLMLVKERYVKQFSQGVVFRRLIADLKRFAY